MNSTGLLNFESVKDLKSIIKVIGVGGGGNNAVNHMFRQGIKDVDFINCNTDHQALTESPVPIKIKLGSRELGAGSKPEVGQMAAEESREDIKTVLAEDTKMVFVTAGMGGGTGTGGAPVVASIAKELNILTVGIVTAPFSWEGRRRIEQARAGIEELKKYVDIILVIENDKLREQYGNQKMTEAFKKADDVLTSAARSIAEIITKHGFVNLDFEDVNTVMTQGGDAIMGVGNASGEGRAIQAAEAAINSPLLNNNDINGARKVLVYIASGNDEISMDEMSEITEFIQERAGNDADVIWGYGIDETLTEELCVTVIATGFDRTATSKSTTTNTYATHPSKREKPAEITTYTLSNAAPKAEKKVNTLNTTEEKPTIKTYHLEDEPATINVQATAEQKTATITEPTLITTPREKSNTAVATAEAPATRPIVKIDKDWRTKPEAEAIKELGERKLQKLKDYGILNKNRLTLSQVQEMESMPAYLRHNVQLSNTPHSSESQISKYALFDGEISESNTFLHVNVD